jgi:signal transduction histidine kinase
MQICLISQDEKLRGALSQIAGSTLSVSPPGKQPPAADLYVWDVHPDFSVNSLTGSARHLLLVDRQQLASLAQQLGNQSACIVLKPASQSTLEAFLGDAGVEALQSDRDALLQQVLRANLRLQEYDQDRTNFLARALHDLRAPLTALHGYCGLLADGEIGVVNSHQAELLQRMRSSTQRMARLVSSMFELSVAGRVERKLNLELGDIEACLNQALHDVSPFLQEKQIFVATQLDPPEKGMFIETHQIEQLLVNLLENACKFTPRRGNIEVRGYSVYWDPHSDLDDSALASNAYRIEIRDSGPGIDPSVLDSIFEEYTSCSGASDRSGGLGLAICKMIASAHGGKIWAESSRDGAVFFVLLPFEPKRSIGRPGAKSEVGFAASVQAKYGLSV